MQITIEESKKRPKYAASHSFLETAWLSCYINSQQMASDGLEAF